MNDKLRLLLCTAGLAASSLTHAQTTVQIGKGSVSIYGIAGIDALRYSDVYNAAGANQGSVNKLDSGTLSTSRLGFKGMQPLGGGTSALFTLEAGVATDTGNTTAGRVFNRGTYVGLDGNWGRLTAGRQWNINDDILGNYFIFGGFAAFRFSDFGDISNLYDSSLKYVSPSMGGFKAEALYGFGETPGSARRGSTTEFGGSYTGGPFSVAATYHAMKGAVANTDKLSSFGANYNFGPARLRLGAAWSDMRASALLKARVYDLGVDFTSIPKTVVSVDYVSRDQRATSNDTRFWRVLGTYDIWENTTVYANVIRLRNKGVANEAFQGPGGLGQGLGAPGQSQTVLGAGMRYTF